MFRGSRLGQQAMIIFAVLLSGIAALGSQVAQRDAEEWIKTLESPNRLARLRVDDVVAALGLRSGFMVADIGAGTGVFSRPIAKAVSPGGKVYAVDIDQELLDYIDQRSRSEHIDNIQTVLGRADDPQLPTHDIDLVFFNDVLHHIENGAAYLKVLSPYIKPDGRIALVEFDKPPGGESRHPFVTREQADQWMSDAGFYPQERHDEIFPNGGQWFTIYRRK
jgi:ubiquinone/menaquinone biosynthesis C-methylase UbiE